MRHIQLLAGRAFSLLSEYALSFIAIACAFKVATLIWEPAFVQLACALAMLLATVEIVRRGLRAGLASIARWGKAGAVVIALLAVLP